MKNENTYSIFYFLRKILNFKFFKYLSIGIFFYLVDIFYFLIIITIDISSIQFLRFFLFSSCSVAVVYTFM